MQHTNLYSSNLILYAQTVDDGLTQIGNHKWYSHSHPIFISDVDISLFLNKVFYSVVMAPFSCNVQGSPLREKEKKQKKTVANVVISV